MRRAFTLMECMIVVAIITTLVGIGAASYRRLKWTSHVVDQSIHNRGLLNQAVADGKFKSQKRFDEEQARLKRQTEIGLTQGD